MAVYSKDSNQQAQNLGPKQDGPIRKQLSFDWSSTDKYAELKNYKVTAKDMFQNYSISQAERVTIIEKNWHGRQDLQLLEALSQAEQKVCNTEFLFETLSNKFKQQYNETIKLLQFYKLVKQHNENAEEWMGRHRITAIECDYKEIDRHLKEQFIHKVKWQWHDCRNNKEAHKTAENKDVKTNEVLQRAR